MTGFSYAASQIAAVWNMARGRAGWTAELDRSVDGVFRSFSAMLYAAPLLILSFAATRAAALRSPELAEQALVSAPLAVFAPIQLLAAYVDWSATLALLAFLARAVGASRRAADLIIGYNWLQIPLAGVQAAASTALLLSGGEIGALLALPVLVIAIALLWGYLRRTLALDPVWTLSVLILLTLTGLIVQSIVTSTAYGLYRAFS